MRDVELERYVTTIEEHLGRRRGRDHALSPPDFDLVRRWHAAGVPVGDILAAVDAVVADGRDPTSLALCRPRVESRPGRAPLRSAGAGEPRPATAREDRPAAIRRALDALEPSRAGLFPGTRAALEALRGPGDREGLLGVEDVLGREAVAALDPHARAEVERRVERAASRQRGRVSEAALEAARTRQLRSAALRSLGLDPP